ncbi:MAG TPA: hypothetical protein ENK17_06630, partial [Anaerolineae bacterium]|nr:hypothetical protein [Anaerolineae bacterium]
MVTVTEEIGSILLADCGTVTTKAVLLEKVAGRYRFVAQGETLTTTEYPWMDVAEGIRHAAEQIAAVTGRKFLDSSRELISPEEPGRRGVDVFAATASASPSLEVVLGGLVRDLSVASMERAAAGTYSLVKGVLACDGQVAGGRRRHLSDAERVRLVYDAAPDVVCIAGGIEGGAVGPVLELVETVALAGALMDPDSRPLLLYAGNSRLHKYITRLAGKWVREIRTVDNVRPTLTDENLHAAREELYNLYIQEKMGLLPGYESLAEWSAIPLTPTASAFGRLLRYLWHLGDQSKGILGIDLGGANTTIAAVFDDRLYLTIRGDLGVAFGGARFAEERGPERLLRWLPDEMSGDALLGMLINKEMHPASVPQEGREVRVEQALAREAIRTAMATARPGWRPGEAQLYPRLLPLCDKILISGDTLARAPRPGQAALTVIDAVEPIGVCTLVLDVYGMAAALGNVASLSPQAAVEALESGALTNLATVIAPVGRSRPGDLILKVGVTYDDGSTFDVEVHYGNIEVLPLPPGQEAELELRPARHIDVGLGGPGKSGKQRVSGSLVGLIIDGRGRPLTVSGKPEERRAQM